MPPVRRALFSEIFPRVECALSSGRNAWTRRRRSRRDVGGRAQRQRDVGGHPMYDVSFSIHSFFQLWEHAHDVSAE